MITCTKCKQEKNESEFYNRKDTKTKKTEKCKLCVNLTHAEWEKRNPHYQRDYCNARRLKNKLSIIEKLGGKCVHCGLVDNHVVYDLHHLDPSIKEYSLGLILDHSQNKIQSELDKCILLCSNCHRKEHDRLRKEVGYGPNQKDLTEIKM